MMKYRIIDKRERNTREELKEYTFEELKTSFEPNKEELLEYWEKWNEIKDLYDLEEYLKWESDGMEVPFIFEEIKQF